MDERDLIESAIEARKNAYTPYSNFKVGAALLTKSGKIYLGCNIESASFTPTICAERTAFFKAISDGEKDFESIAIVGGLADIDNYYPSYCSPCGVCRQVMMEFCNPTTFQIIMGKTKDDYIKYSLQQLLPLGFGPNNLV